MTPAEASAKAVVDVPLRGFNLVQYLYWLNPMEWDFAKVKEEIEALEAEVKAIKGVI